MESTHIDGLPAAEDPDIQYIEWMTLPPTGASAALVQQIIGDSDRRRRFRRCHLVWISEAYKATSTEQMKSVHTNVQILELDLDAHRALLTGIFAPWGPTLGSADRQRTVQRGATRRPGGDTDTLDAMTPPLATFFAALPDS